MPIFLVEIHVADYPESDIIFRNSPVLPEEELALLYEAISASELPFGHYSFWYLSSIHEVVRLEKTMGW